LLEVLNCYLSAGIIELAIRTMLV